MRRFFLILISLLLAAGATFVSLQLSLFGNSILFEAGDYYFEVDPVMLQFLQSPGIDFYNSFFPPQMTPVSVVIRAPVVWAAEALGLVTAATDPIFSQDEFRGRYLAGAATLLMIGFSLLVFSIGRAFPEYWKGKERSIRHALVYLICLVLATLLLALNPLITSSVVWGHPEETLMGAFLVAGALALIRGRTVPGAILLGLAMATKQPAIFIAPAAFLLVPPEERRRFVGWLLGAALVGIVPWVLTHPVDFFQQNILVAGSQDFNVKRGFELLTPLGLRNWGEIGKPLIALVSLLLPLSLARLNQDVKSWRVSALRIGAGQMAAATVIVFAVRFSFDLGNISYYALPAGLSLLLLDYLWQRDPRFPWRKTFPNPPVVFPFFTLIGSLYYGLVFYQDLFQDMGSDWRGSFTLIMIGFPLVLAVLVTYQPVSGRIGRRQWLTAFVTILGAALLLTGYHNLADQPKRERLYKELKEYKTNERMLRALPPGQEGFWLGENPVGLELRFRALDGNVVFTAHSPEGRRTTYFDYGRPGARGSLEITTYNTTLADRKVFINQCLAGQGSCLGYRPLRDLPAGDALISGKQGRWDAYLRAPNGQTIYLKSSDPEIRPEQVLRSLQEME